MEQEIIINDEFLAKRPLSFSSLKEFAKSPKHYIEYVKTKERTFSDQILLGSVVDCLLFTPKEFFKKYLIANLKKGKSKKAAQENESTLEYAAANKKTIVSTELLKLARYLVNELKTYPRSKKLVDTLKGGQIKLSWTDKETGLPLVGFVDGESRTDGSFDYDCWDLKTAKDTSDKDFMRSITNFHYYLQIGVYALGYQRKYFRFPNWYFVTIENVIPYNVNVFQCSPKMVQQGKDEVMHLLRAFRKCMNENKFWMSYDFWLHEDMPYRIIDIPPYAKLHYND